MSRRRTRSAHPSTCLAKMYSLRPHSEGCRSGEGQKRCTHASAGNLAQKNVRLVAGRDEGNRHARFACIENAGSLLPMPMGSFVDTSCGLSTIGIFHEARVGLTTEWERQWANMVDLARGATGRLVVHAVVPVWCYLMIACTWFLGTGFSFAQHF